MFVLAFQNLQFDVSSQEKSEQSWEVYQTAETNEAPQTGGK